MTDAELELLPTGTVVTLPTLEVLTSDDEGAPVGEDTGAVLLAALLEGPAELAELEGTPLVTPVDSVAGLLETADEETWLELSGTDVVADDA